jgi:hypothetical protein
VVGSRTGPNGRQVWIKGAPSSIQIAPTPARVAIAPRAMPPPRTMTVVVAQATDPSTPDLCESQVPTRTTWTETVTEKHASGRDWHARSLLANRAS